MLSVNSGALSRTLLIVISFQRSLVSNYFDSKHDGFARSSRLMRTRSLAMFAIRTN